jgi:hypothetical protein
MKKIIHGLLEQTPTLQRIYSLALRIVVKQTPIRLNFANSVCRDHYSDGLCILSISFVVSNEAMSRAVSIIFRATGMSVMAYDNSFQRGAYSLVKHVLEDCATELLQNMHDVQLVTGSSGESESTHSDVDKT